MMRVAARSILRAKRFDVRFRRQVFGAVAILDVDHHALAVLHRRSADEGAKRRLMIGLATTGNHTNGVTRTKTPAGFAERSSG